MTRIFCIENRDAVFVDAFVKSAQERGFDLQLLRPMSNEPRGYTKFRSIYRHFSVNPVSFELACFRRYFDVLKLTHHGDRFIIADSDLLINCSEKLMPRTFSDFDGGLIASVGIKGGVFEEDISPHFSYWTHPLLRQFVEYLIAKYECDTGSLQASFVKRQMLGNKRAAIADMALLYMFIRETGTKFLNSNSVIDSYHIDHNLSMGEAINTNFRMEFGFKAFRADSDGILFLTENGEWVRPAVIHLQGRAKIASYHLLEGRLVHARGRLAMISTMRQIRKLLA